MRMDRADKLGTGISAALHLGLIAWAIVGGDLFRARPTDPVVMTEVSVMSEADFAALVAAAPRPSETPATQPVAPSVPAESAEAPESEAVPAPALEPQPEPLPEPEPAPEPAPDMTDLTTPPAEAEVTEVPPMQPMPPVEEPSQTVLMEISPRPRPRPAPRVAPTPAEAPEPDARVSDTAVAETRPDEATEPEEVVEPPEEEAAPPEATTEIVTEATETDDRPQSSAPLTSARPRPRPAKPAAPAPAQSAAARPAAPASEPAVNDAVNDALAEAMSSETGTGSGGVGRAVSGPPLTSGEKDALIVDVKACWNVGALSTEALRTTVTVGVTMLPDGRPDIGSIRRIGHEGGSEAAANQAYEAGRRAIVRCGSDGFPLPAEKYDHWREIEIVFNPEKMRMK